MNAWSVALLALTAGCSSVPALVFENKSVAVVGVHFDGDDGTLGWQDEIKSILSGDKWRVRTHRAARDDRLALQVGPCEYKFRATVRDLPGQPSGTILVGAQIHLDEDGAPYLVPVVSPPHTPRQAAALNAFALRPTSRACP